MLRRLLPALLLFAIPAMGQTTRTAVDCTAANVQAKINLSANGDIVLVPGGTCTWDTSTNKVTISSSQQITLNGQGITTINFGGSGTAPGGNALTVNGGSSTNTFITGFTFVGSYINGGCPIALNDGTQTFRFFNNTLDDGTPHNPGTIICVGGIGPGLIDHNTFTIHFSADEVIHNVGINDATGWTTDVVPGGPNMLFVETNTFTFSGQPVTPSSAIQSYNGARTVFRHNTLGVSFFIDQHAGGAVSGARWWEVYGNSSNVQGNASFNAASYADIRGGSGVYWGNTSTGNVFQTTNLPGIRIGPLSGSSDPQSGPWPINWQIGRGINETYSPAYIWSNPTYLNPTPGSTNPSYVQIGTTPSNASCVANGTTGHPTSVCDAVFGGTSQPTTLLRCESAADVTAGCPVSYNYVPYTYPHPLVGGAVSPPSAPTGLTASVSGSTVTLNWTASSGTPVPTGYTLYRGTVHNGPYTLVKSGITSTSTTDTPASGTYFYVVTAFVGGIVSTISGNGTVATVTCTITCAFPTGTVLTIGGDSTAAFNGTFTSTSQNSPTSFTFASSSSASGTGGGAWQSTAESARSNEVQATAGATPTVSLAPLSLAFSNVNVGSNSPSQSTTLTNTSGAGVTVTVSGISVTGTNPGDFILGEPGLVPSGPITISGQSGTVIKGLRITSTTGNCVTVTSSTNITIEQSEIGPCTGGSAANGIRISGGSTIKILDNYIHQTNSSGSCCDTHDGIFANNGINGLTIQGNVIAYGESNIEVQDSSNITVNGNFLLNPLDSNPSATPDSQSRGQNFQCWQGGLSTGCSTVTFQNNYALSSSDTTKYTFAGNQEDSVNFGFTNTATVSGNYVTGGTSPSGCGMIADDSANSINFSSNLLLNTGQCGIGIADGTNNVVNANKIYNIMPVTGGGNTAIYAWKIYTAPCGPTTISNNIADALAVGGAHNTYFDGGGCSPTLTSNTFDAAADSLLTPVSTVFPAPKIPPGPAVCVIASPYTNNTGVTACSQLPVTVPSGGALIVLATFAPTAAGARSASITFVDNATGSPQTVPMSGTGVGLAPAVTLVPTSLTFGAQLTTTTSVAQPIVLQNSGTGTLSISSISASGDFGETNTCGSTLGAGLTCTISVTFTPTATGTRTGTLSVSDNATGSPHTASLKGTGIAAKCDLTGTSVLTGITIVCHP